MSWSTLFLNALEAEEKAKFISSSNPSSINPTVFWLEGFKTLKDGQSVAYNEGSSEKGPCATNVIPQ